MAFSCESKWASSPEFREGTTFHFHFVCIRDFVMTRTNRKVKLIPVSGIVQWSWNI